VCIQDLHLVALGNLRDWGFFVTLSDCHHLDGLVDCDSVEARKEIVRCFIEEIVRGTLLTLRGSRRATLVDCLWLGGSPS